MRKKEIQEIVKDIKNDLYKNNSNIYDLKLEIMGLKAEINQDRKKRERKEILKDYDFAILIKGRNTILLEKGKQEKYITDYTLEQSCGELPTIEYTKICMPERKTK